MGDGMGGGMGGGDDDDDDDDDFVLPKPAAKKPAGKAGGAGGAGGAGAKLADGLAAAGAEAVARATDGAAVLADAGKAAWGWASRALGKATGKGAEL
jgi:hypothetical protein